MIGLALAILFLPLAGFIILIFFGRRLPRQGDVLETGFLFAALALAASAGTAQAQYNRVQAHVAHPVQAQMTPSTRSDLLAAQRTLAWRSVNSKGVQRDALSFEERKIDGLIDDLERGRAVDPREIDRVLEHANRGF